jgi:hypothetical protein
LEKWRVAELRVASAAFHLLTTYLQGRASYFIGKYASDLRLH